MKKYGYFGPDANDEIMTDDECYIGFVLNHFLEVNQFNAHEVAQVCIFLGLIGVHITDFLFLLQLQFAIISIANP